MLSTGQGGKRLGISVRTVYRWEAAGRRVPITRLESGQRRFSSRDVDALLRLTAHDQDRCAVYARVSSEKQAEAGNLQRQKDRLVMAAKERGYEVAGKRSGGGFSDGWEGWSAVEGVGLGER